jgi:c-di-GMP-binding flagellar brake protein YcgR
MKQESIKAGEKIELLVDRRGNPERFFSKVESLVTDDTFIISRPIGDEQLMFLSLGEVIRIVYFREDGAYYFDAQVIERIKHQETVSARVVALSEKYKLQRRNYYRLNTMVPVVLTYFEDDLKIVKPFDTIDIAAEG